MHNFISCFNYLLEFEIRDNNSGTRSNARVLGILFFLQKYIQINTVTHSKLLHTVVKKLWQLRKKVFFYNFFNAKLINIYFQEAPMIISKIEAFQKCSIWLYG